jgi:hypothetical protein
VRANKKQSFASVCGLSDDWPAADKNAKFGLRQAVTEGDGRGGLRHSIVRLFSVCAAQQAVLTKNVYPLIWHVVQRNISRW